MRGILQNCGIHIICASNLNNIQTSLSQKNMLAYSFHTPTWFYLNKLGIFDIKLVSHINRGDRYPLYKMMVSSYIPQSPKNSKLLSCTWTHCGFVCACALTLSLPKYLYRAIGWGDYVEMTLSYEYIFILGSTEQYWAVFHPR